MPENNLFLPPNELAVHTAGAHRAADELDALPLSVSPPLAATHPHGMEPAIALEPHGDLSEVEAEWKAFARSADCTAFQSFEWLSNWQQHIGARRGTLPAIVLGRDDRGQLLFILQLAIETRGVVRRLTWLGSELCDYNVPLLARHFSSQLTADQFASLWHDVIQLVRADGRFRFDLVDLPKMPEMVGAQRNPFLAINVQANPSGAHVATLGRSWDEFYAAKRSSATRKKERRQFKHLAEHGEVRSVTVEDKAEIERTLETLFRQKSKAFARMGVEDLFTRPGYRAFYHAIASDDAARDLIHVSRLDVGAATTATSLGLTFRDCYYLVLSSYGDGEVARFGPGRAHLHELLRLAMERGLRKFDFTIGDEPYKRGWSDIEVRLYDHLAAVTLRGALVAAMTTAFRWAKRLIKQTPALWHVYSKMRGLAGGLGRR